jgi:hypothetical protein
VNAAKSSFLSGLISRVFGNTVPASGGYVFNLRGRWRYESHAQRRAQRIDPRGMWSGEVLAYGWLARQAQARAKDAARKPDAQILALTRS